ncbi:DUF6361 family protein [Desulfonatronospira sp.]|uniref:DUF6361 family protein n=1 Tax=Desulfonatronospira sp. TaxID=1962951 RepID=UPI0025C0173D|nr:DUF6361 family protein [Desulfonatronospira sp.]
MFNTSGNPLQIGWIDYSPEHRRKVMTVLQSLAAPGAVDEIGIGQIRDGFSNRLFPGTSTIQTRAKYFFLVPYILMELEKQKNITPNALIQKLNNMELELIEPLLKSGEKGVIGETAGKNLKRKPSSVYWSGLKTFGIFRYPHLSLEEYARAVCAVRREDLNIRSMGVSDDVSSQGDDSDAAGTSLTGGFWRCPPPPENWREHISIHLTYEEALHLRGDIRDRFFELPFLPNSAIFPSTQQPQALLEVHHAKNSQVYPRKPTNRIPCYIPYCFAGPAHQGQRQ